MLLTEFFGKQHPFAGEQLLQAVFVVPNLIKYVLDIALQATRYSKQIVSVKKNVTRLD